MNTKSPGFMSSIFSTSVGRVSNFVKKIGKVYLNYLLVACTNNAIFK